MNIKIFETENPENLKREVKEWINEKEGDLLKDEHFVIHFINQSECAADSDFFHITLTVVWSVQSKIVLDI